MTLLLLSLGGTIACVPTPLGLMPRLKGADLLAALGELPVAVEAQDPLERTIVYPADWITLARYIHDRMKAYRGFVLTLGTDTLAHTACALSLMLQAPPRPVVLTGAMEPLDAHRPNQAQRNLNDALTVAASGAPGVMVVFEGDILAGPRASKVRCDGLHAFESINAPPLGTVEGGRITWLAKPRRSLGQARLCPTLDTDVALVTLSPQTTADWLEPLSRHRGVVVAGYGDGNVSDNLVGPLADLARKAVVVLASQCLYGRVGHRYAGGRALIRGGALSAGGMTTEMAMVRLMWVLGRTRSLGGARRLFGGWLG